MHGIRQRWAEAQQDALDRGTLYAWYATRTRRRIVVAGGAAAVAMPWAGTIVSWHLAPSDTAMWWTIGLFIGSIVIMLPAFGVLNTATRGTVSLAEKKLDERQIAERLRANTIAHRIMYLLLIVLVIAMMSVDGDRDTFVPIAAVVTGVVALYLTHLALPVLVAGWRVADPPPDDEDELDDELDIADEEDR